MPMARITTRTTGAFPNIGVIGKTHDQIMRQCDPGSNF